MFSKASNALLPPGSPFTHLSVTLPKAGMVRPARISFVAVKVGVDLLGVLSLDNAAGLAVDEYRVASVK